MTDLHVRDAVSVDAEAMLAIYEPSVRLHRSLGFSEVGVFRRAGRKFGAWHDVSWWQLELRAAPPAG